MRRKHSILVNCTIINFFRMGYDLHIVRTEDWTDSEAAPITKADVDQLIARDSSLSWSTTDFVDMMEDNGSIQRYYLINWKGEPVFWWWRSEILCKNPSDMLIHKLAEIAESIGALLIGDDGERYELGKSLFSKAKVIVRRS